MEEDSQRISGKDLPWKKFQRKSFQLQCKIYGATQEGNYRAISRFQKLLGRSSSAYYLVIRQILKSDGNIFPINNSGTFDSESKTLLKYIDGLDSDYRNLLYGKEESLHPDDVKITTYRSKLKEKILQYFWFITMEPVYGNFLPKEKNSFKGDIKFWSLQSYTELHLRSSKDTIEKQLFSVNLTQIPIMGSNYLQMKFLTLPSKLTSIEQSGSLFFGGRRLPPTLLTFFSRKIALNELEELNDVKKSRVLMLATKVNLSYHMESTSILSLQNRRCLKSLLVMMQDFLELRGSNISLLTPNSSSLIQRFEILSRGFERIKKEKANAHPLLIYWNLHKKRLKYFLKSSEISLLLRLKKVGYMAERWCKLYYFSQGFHSRSKSYSMKMWVNKNVPFFIKNNQFLLQDLGIYSTKHVILE